MSCACIALPSLDGEDSRVVRNVFDPHHLVKDVGHLLLGVISRRIDSGPLVVLWGLRLWLGGGWGCGCGWGWGWGWGVVDDDKVAGLGVGTGLDGDLGSVGSGGSLRILFHFILLFVCLGWMIRCAVLYYYWLCIGCCVPFGINRRIILLRIGHICYFYLRERERRDRDNFSFILHYILDLLLRGRGVRLPFLNSLGNANNFELVIEYFSHKLKLMSCWAFVCDVVYDCLEDGGVAEDPTVLSVHYGAVEQGLSVHIVEEEVYFGEEDVVFELVL